MGDSANQHRAQPVLLGRLPGIPARLTRLQTLMSVLKTVQVKRGGSRTEKWDQGL